MNAARVRSALRHPYALRAARVAIGLVFLAAALSKLGDLEAFAKQIHNFRILPIALENLAAMTLPWIELLAGLALVLDVRPRGGAWVVTGLMAIFTVAVAQAVVRELDIECGCFGTADASRVGLAKLAENIGLTLLALWASLRADRTAARAAAPSEPAFAAATRAETR